MAYRQNRKLNIKSADVLQVTFGLIALTSILIGGTQNFATVFITIIKIAIGLLVIIGIVFFINFIRKLQSQTRSTPAEISPLDIFKKFEKNNPTLNISTTPTIEEIENQLKKIDWFQFEKVTKRILEEKGWHVKHTGGAFPDGGIDLIATKDDQIAAIQCKHYQTNQIPVKIVRELLGAQVSHQSPTTQAILFCTPKATQPAHDLAQAHNISIYEIQDIAQDIKAIGHELFPELLNPEIKYCPKCGANMTYRHGKFSGFWGCSTYPKCKGKIK